MQQERGGACSFAVGSQLPLLSRTKDCEELKPKPKEKWIFVYEKSEETKHRTECFAEADRYRCMRCGKESKYMKMLGKCSGPKFLSKNSENGEDDTWRP